MRIHLAGKHALEFELLDVRAEPVDIIRNSDGCAVVVLGLCQFEQFIGTGQTVAKRANAVDDPVERGAFLAQLLGPFRVVPDVRVLELAGYFLETLALGVVVKDTP
jgi:hypothetical protein